MKVSIILGIGAVLMLLLFFFVLVAHHRDILERAEQHRGALLGTGSSVAERTKPSGLMRHLAHGDHRVNAISAGVPIAPAHAAVRA